MFLVVQGLAEVFLNLLQICNLPIGSICNTPEGVVFLTIFIHLSNWEQAQLCCIKKDEYLVRKDDIGFCPSADKIIKKNT